MKKIRIQKKTSDCQDRIERLPNEFAEFQLLERAQSGNYLGMSWVEPAFETAANRRFDDLDKLFGFEHESVMRKVGVESSHWAGRK